jgi:ABC-type hemin transport system substrate-binding protein
MLPEDDIRGKDMPSPKKVYVSTVLAALFFFSLCSGEKKEGVPVMAPPERVVSLSPSITRQIIDLGGENILVGVTSYHPPLKKKSGNNRQPGPPQHRKDHPDETGHCFLFA